VNDAVTIFGLLKRYSSGARSRTRANAVALPLHFATLLLSNHHWLIQLAQRNVGKLNTTVVLRSAASMKTP
jgi:hypothetical protein